MSYVMHGKSMKVIAALLLISPKTVEAHIRNIMQKLDCNSQDGIRTIVEKSGKLVFVKQYYYYLLIESSFNEQLKSLSRLISKQNISCFFTFMTEENNDLLEVLKHHLEFVGIKVLKDTNDIIENIYEIHVISKPLALEINNVQSKKDVNKCLQKYVGNNKNKILLLINKDINISKTVDYISFQHRQEYYNSFFEVLKKLLPKIDIDELIKDFKNQYQGVQNFLGNTYIKTSTYSTGFIFKWFNNIYRINFISWKALWVVVLLCLSSFYLFSLIPFDLVITGNKSNNTKKNITWNLPRFPEYYVERKELTNAIWDKFSDEKKRKTAVLVGLNGLGGIGKTTLALNAIYNAKQRYDFKVWFSSETKDLLKANYFELGERFRLFSKDMSDKLKIRIVKEWLDNKRNVLLVYDNAPDMETLNDFLPNKGHIIITSRNYKLSGSIAVDVMTKTEAVNLLNKLTSLSTNCKKQSERLILELGYLPLAISQAGSYINENKLTVSNYLKLYKTNKMELLAEESLPPGDIHEPIYVTWNINIKNIKTHSYGDKALKLLDFISYCYPENIPKKLLIQYLYGNVSNETKILFNKVLKLLRQYSLIKVSSDTISIHRLVHDWIKTTHTKTDRLNILQKGMDVVKTMYPWENKTSKDIEFIKYLIPHVRFILLKVQPLFKKVVVVDLMSILGDSYNILGNYIESKQLLEEAFILNKKYYGFNHIKTSKMLHCLGWTYFCLGNYVKSKQLLEKALVVRKKHYGFDHMEVARTLHHLSWTYLYLGNYLKSKELSEKVLVIREKHYGLNHVETSRTLHHLGWVHLHLGNYTKAKQLSEKALTIRSKYYGPDHIKTSHTLHHLGWIHLRLGNYVKSKQMLEKALEIRTKYYNNSDHIIIVSSLNGVGIYNYYVGNYVKSRSLLERGLNMVTKLYGNNHLFTAMTLSHLGNMHRMLNNFNESKKLLEDSFQFLHKYYGSDNINVSIVMCNLGLLYGELHDDIKKKKYLKKALITFKEKLSSENVYIKQILDEFKENNSNKSKGCFIIF